MLEPTIIRQAATLTEWDGTRGKAAADNGVLYDLDLSNMQHDLIGRLPEQGERVELYLHQDERGETEFVECCIMPSFDRQGGLHFHLNDKVYENTKGQRFYAHIAALKRRYFWDITWCIVLLLILFFLSARKGALVENAVFMLLCVGKIVFDLIRLRRDVREPECYDNWLFTLNHQGMAFKLMQHRDGSFVNWRSWADIEHITLKKNHDFETPILANSVPKIRIGRTYHSFAPFRRK